MRIGRTMRYRHVARLWLTIAVTALMLIVGATAGMAGSTDQVTINVEGMTCPGCEATVESVLSAVEGVTVAQADRRTQTAVATYDPQRTAPQQLVEAVNTQTYYVASLAGSVDAQQVGDDREQAATVAVSTEQSRAPPYVLWALAGLTLAVVAGVGLRMRRGSETSASGLPR